MKLEIKLIPSDMNEAQAILKALGGFTIVGTQKVVVKDEASAITTALNSKSSEEGITEVAGMVEGEPAVNAPNVEVPPLKGDEEAKVGTSDLPTLKDLTLGAERDSANRLWCKEINTSNKGTKDDDVFKRKPKVDDAYFDHVINLLEQEAITYEPEPTVAPVPEIATLGDAAKHAEQNGTDTPTAPVPAPQPEPAPAPQSEPAPAPQPEPAPAPQPEPAPAPQRVVVAYMYNGQRYNPEQLAGWSAEQIAANCEPVYDDVAPVETSTVCLETQVKPLVSELAGNDGMAIHCQKLCGLLSGQEKGIPQDVPEEKRAQLLKALETMKANKVAVKDGSMPVEQLI